MGRRNLVVGLSILFLLFIISIAASSEYEDEQADAVISTRTIPLSYENTRSRSRSRSKGQHFVLVHGACLGAWSWYKLIHLLEASGHRATAIDLAASGINPLQASQLNSISEYFQPLIDFMASLPSHERVILVGHSLGGWAISHAMEHFPHKIAVAVFVTASMPGPALNVSTLSHKNHWPMLDNKFIYDDGPNNPPTSFIFGPTFLSQELYDLSPLEDVYLALLLIRPLRIFSSEDTSRVMVLTEDKYGSIPRVYIKSGRDRLVNKTLEKWIIEKNPPTRVETIQGSDHMVMVSQPQQLGSHLLRIAADFGCPPGPLVA